ncbi:T9SS type A sorting domain-containing protein [Flavobacterium sp.]
MVGLYLKKVILLLPVKKNIDLSNCQSGIYIIKINSSEFTYFQKIIKN